MRKYCGVGWQRVTFQHYPGMQQNVKQKEVMLCADFNHSTINLNELKATAEGQSFLDLTQDLQVLGLIQPVETATRHGNVLDLVLTTTPNLVRNVHVTEPFGSSDHSIVEFTVVCRIEYTDWKN